MAEPERLDDAGAETAPEVALEPEVLDASAPAPAPEAPVPLAGTVLPQNLHVSLWTTPVSYVCLRCSATGFTHEGVCLHVRDAHGEEPKPTPLTADYLAHSPVVRAMVGEEGPEETAVLGEAQPEDDAAPPGEEPSP